MRRFSEKNQKKIALRPPMLKVSPRANCAIATLNKKAYELLNSTHVTVVEIDGEICIYPIKVPEGTEIVVSLKIPDSGAIRTYLGKHRNKLATNKKYICKWDDVNERLIINPK